MFETLLTFSFCAVDSTEQIEEDATNMLHKSQAPKRFNTNISG